MHHPIPPSHGWPSTELPRTVLQVLSAVGSIRRPIVHGGSPRGIDCCLYRGRGCEKAVLRLEPHGPDNILRIACMIVAADA